MKKETKIILAIVIALIIALAILLSIKMNKKVINVTVKASALKVENQNDLEKLANQIYEGVEIYPNITTTSIDLKDENANKLFSKIGSIDKIDYAIASESNIESLFHSMVLLKVKSGVNANEIAKELFEEINSQKLTNLNTEKVYATSSGDIAFLVVSNNKTAKHIYENFKNLAQGIGTEYEKLYR